MSEPSEPSEPSKAEQDVLARLQAFEEVGAELWPFVRFFGLCGADPRAMSAVARLGALLGETEPAVVHGEVADSTRELVIEQCAQFLADHRFMGRQVLRKHAEILVREFRELKRESRGDGS